jgi:hypothetical protein
MFSADGPLREFPVFGGAAKSGKIERLSTAAAPGGCLTALRAKQVFVAGIRGARAGRRADFTRHACRRLKQVVQIRAKVGSWML